MIKGRYIVREDGIAVAEVDNMLTSFAKQAILEHLAGVNRTWASAVAVGSFNTEPEFTDRRLGFEIGRGDIDAKAADLDSSSVLVKATIPKRVEGQIYELGIYSSSSKMGRSEDQLLISDFNPEENDVEGFTGKVMRVGRQGAVMDVPINDTATGKFIDMGFDISAMNTNNRMVLAYDAQGANNVEIRLVNAPGDYMSYSFVPESVYSSISWRLEDFIPIGNGSLSRPFTEIHAVVDGGGAGGALSLDGLRIDDTDVFADQMLVSRAVLTDPITKRASSEIEIEYSISIEF